MAIPSRQTTTRSATQRRLPRFQDRGKLYIDPSVIPADKVYKWARESTLGYYDGENIGQNQLEGWTPVPLSTHPEWVPPAYDTTKAPETLIRRGGMMLMEMPKDEYEEYQASLRDEHAETLRSIDKDRGDAAAKQGVPVEREITSRTERNRRFED